MTSRPLLSRLTFPGLGLLGALAAPAAASAGTPVLFDKLTTPAGVTLASLPDSTVMSVVLSLPLRDAAGAAKFAAAVSDPDNALYGKYLTPAQYGARFGADPATYEALRSWAQAQGFVAGARTYSHSFLTLKGTAGQFARLFQTRFASFHTAEHGDGRALLSQPVLPAALAGKVSGVVGLASIGQYAPLLRPRTDTAHPQFGTGVGGGYSPSDLRTAYNVPAQSSSAKTEVVGLFEEAGYVAADIAKFTTQYGLPTIPVTVESVDGSGTSGNSFEVRPEVDLDIDSVTGMNPSIAAIHLYVDSIDSFSVQLVDAFDLMAQDDVAQTISVSYGEDEAQQGDSGIAAENTALIQLQAQGQTVFASSGDDGSTGREGGTLHASDPASQPLLTSVGGTTLATASAGGAWSSETVWNDSKTSATGGGVSSVWTIPSWQLVKGVSVAAKNGGSSTMRNEPDIAAVADPNTGFSIYVGGILGGGWSIYGGTSLSSPLWAAMTTIIDSNRVAKSLPRVGYFNPLLYKGGETGFGFHDIVSGNNGTPGYTAGPGYDNCSGWGSINLGLILPKTL